MQQARQVIADRLREMREQAGLTGPGHALVCGWNKSKTSRIENNRTKPSAEDIRTWCRVCGADDQAADLVESLRVVEGMFVEWQRMERNGLYQLQRARAPIYERTQRFRSYSPSLVPGMLQTPEYIRRVLGTIQRWRELPDDVDEAVTARIERQRFLTEGDRVFAFVIEEQILYSDTAPPDVMAGQLRRLLETARMPNVSLGIIPMRLGRPLRSVEGFWIFDDTHVSVELVSGLLTVTQAREVAVYADTFARLAAMAVVGPEARAIIADAARALNAPSASPSTGALR